MCWMEEISSCNPVITPFGNAIFLKSTPHFKGKDVAMDEGRCGSLAVCLFMGKARTRTANPLLPLIGVKKLKVMVSHNMVCGAYPTLTWEQHLHTTHIETKRRAGGGCLCKREPCSGKMRRDEIGHRSVGPERKSERSECEIENRTTIQPVTK
ncbi:unnamed protein product [Allacma fusca]|uniref:Uncharacterized protein n=1 Tax=Allacma fusca TaxID=39272 RepID=A0A8J2P0F0_9HEXA|nr:unnamed protein product [Allacma fusca]